MKQVTVEELRENLDELLSEVAAGESIAIVRDGHSIGTLGPIGATTQRGKRFPFRDLEISPLPKPLGVDPLQALLEERERDRSGEKYGL